MEFGIATIKWFNSMDYTFNKWYNNMKKLNEEEAYTLFNIIIVLTFLLIMFR
tara:strand:+ start:10 stop:165 length:156 start_codon:yes stop_codon:yes gene_type:complete